MKLLPAFLLSLTTLVCSAALRAAPISFGDGERFNFRVSWGLFSEAAEITIAARAEQSAGLSQIRVTTTTATRGMIRKLYSFDGRAESVFDSTDGRMLAAVASTSTKKKKTHAMAVFDYTAANVRYEDYLRPHRSLNIPLPAGQPMDLITSLIESRAWNLKVGDRRPTTVMFDDEFYDLTLVAEKIERVETPTGTYDTLVIVPLMEKDPKGMFKRGGTVRVWISQDEKHLPVKLEVSLKYGTGTAWLTDYRPPFTPVALRQP
ncbi:hypothetical protein CMV30_01770 [Nibricoccus aquaticus]|uniref:DUF3108 domain-containing protein n=1 Tax=Nibricoccus aquaticus TaxID=2576891 RepID=A0A290Q2Q8_9BACT|nr:DUF3108 domain-containing protein [Nibricoccus aquaticus]ATC62794.1 hypothetical protein CMV30_01770 [Nibricoccus aquaticus]